MGGPGGSAPVSVSRCAPFYGLEGESDVKLRSALLLPVAATIGLASALAFGEGAQGDLLPTLPTTPTLPVTVPTVTTATVPHAPPVPPLPPVPAAPPVRPVPSALPVPHAPPAVPPPPVVIQTVPRVPSSTPGASAPSAARRSPGLPEQAVGPALAGSPVGSSARDPDQRFVWAFAGPPGRPSAGHANALLDPRPGREAGNDAQLPARTACEGRARRPRTEPGLRHRGHEDGAWPSGAEPRRLLRASTERSPGGGGLHDHDRGRPRTGPP